MESRLERKRERERDGVREQNSGQANVLLAA